LNLRTIAVIARKEFRDVLRDRRTLLFMLLIPIVAMPLLIMGGARIAKDQLKAKERRVLTIAADPLAKNQITSLAHRWWGDHVGAGMAVASRLGGLELKDLASLDGLSRLASRAESLKNVSSNSRLADAAMLAGAKAYQELSADQKQMLDDVGVITHLLELTHWRKIDDLISTEPLPPGVTVPDDLPGGLGEPGVALAITKKDKEVHAAMYVPRDLYDRLESEAVSVPVTLVYDSSQSLSKEAYDRLEAFVEALERHEIELRLTAHELSPGFVRPFDLKPANIASASRQIQAVIGGFLPYLIILFCFFGAFYPSLDLTAGEKERFTLETLLLAPVSRVEIAAGKFIVVFAAAIIAAVLTTTSMALTFTHGVLPEGAAEAFDLEFEPLALVLTVSLLIPIAALFSALLLGVALCARSFKEAQSYATPLQFVIIVPAIAALMPDLETKLGMAWIPLMNVSLLMKELLKGNYLWEFYAITLGSMLVLTAIVLWWASWLFRRETVLMRT
jgi:sodium transport system permease protein